MEYLSPNDITEWSADSLMRTHTVKPGLFWNGSQEQLKTGLGLVDVGTAHATTSVHNKDEFVEEVIAKVLEVWCRDKQSNMV